MENEVFEMFKKTCDDYKGKNDKEIEKLHNKITDNRKELETKMDDGLKTISDEIKTNRKKQNKYLFWAVTTLIAVLVSALGFLYSGWHTQQNKRYEKLIDLIINQNKTSQVSP